MYLTPQEIAQTRESTLANLLDMSSAWIAAGQRISSIFSNGGREAIQHGSRHWSMFNHGQVESLTQFPVALWLEAAARIGSMLDGTLIALGETQKALIRNAEAQVRVFDQVVFTTINRASKSSPWETAIALRAMRTTLESAEQTLHGMSEAAIETVALAEREAHPSSDTRVESKPAPRKRAPARKVVVSE